MLINIQLVINKTFFNIFVQRRHIWSDLFKVSRAELIKTKLFIVILSNFVLIIILSL